jgi:hypothetical protein
MNQAGLATSIALAASLLLALHAQADEKEVPQADVPKSVIDSVSQKYPKARMTGFETTTDQGKTTFEIGLQNGDERLEVLLAPDGKILEEETSIAARDLPAEVKKGLAGSKYAKWAVERIERIVVAEKVDAPKYELLLADRNSTTEVVFDKAGTITKEEPKGKHERDD